MEDGTVQQTVAKETAKQKVVHNKILMHSKKLLMES